MPDVPEPTLDLLSRLLGKRTAKRVYRGSLTELFAGETVPEEVRLQLRASRELVQRWMLEDMRQQPLLANPRIVREYLAVHYVGHGARGLRLSLSRQPPSAHRPRGNVPGNHRRCLGASPRGREAGAEARTPPR